MKFFLRHVTECASLVAKYQNASVFNKVHHSHPGLFSQFMAWYTVTCRMWPTNTLTNENTWALTALPHRALLVSILGQRWQMMPWRHAMTLWRHMTWQSEPALVNPSENPKITFFDLATLTFNLQTHPIYCHGQTVYQILGPPIDRFSRESADRETDRQDQFYTLDHWGGKE